MVEIAVGEPVIIHEKPTTPAESLSLGYMRILRNTLSELVASPGFRADQVIPAFQERCETVGNDVIRQAVHDEYYSPHVRQPLTDFLGLSQTEEYTVPEVPERKSGHAGRRDPRPQALYGERHLRSRLPGVRPQPGHRELPGCAARAAHG